jgi:hypothetical protein
VSFHSHEQRTFEFSGSWVPREDYLIGFDNASFQFSHPAAKQLDLVVVRHEYSGIVLLEANGELLRFDLYANRPSIAALPIWRSRNSGPVTVNAWIDGRSAAARSAEILLLGIEVLPDDAASLQSWQQRPDRPRLSALEDQSLTLEERLSRASGHMPPSTSEES